MESSYLRVNEDFARKKMMQTAQRRSIQRQFLVHKHNTKSYPCARVVLFSHRTGSINGLTHHSTSSINYHHCNPCFIPVPRIIIAYLQPQGARVCNLNSRIRGPPSLKFSAPPEHKLFIVHNELTRVVM